MQSQAALTTIAAEFELISFGSKDGESSKVKSRDYKQELEDTWQCVVIVKIHGKFSWQVKYIDILENWTWNHPRSGPGRRATRTGLWPATLSKDASVLSVEGPSCSATFYCLFAWLCETGVQTPAF